MQKRLPKQKTFIDIFIFKQKRKTRASVATEKGLAPLADFILEQTDADVNAKAQEFIDQEKGVETVEQALAGASDIIAERISDDANLRKALRKLLVDTGSVACKLLENENAKTYDMYNEYSEKISSMPSHRILAINRGEKEECLKVTLVKDEESFVNRIKQDYFKLPLLVKMLLQG